MKRTRTDECASLLPVNGSLHSFSSKFEDPDFKAKECKCGYLNTGPPPTEYPESIS
jgi:hypothetical protein